MRSLVLITLLTALTPGLRAQRMGGPHFAPGSNFGRSNFAAFPRSRFYPLALADPLYADYLSAGYPMASPPVIFVQASPTTEPQTLVQPVQPLMIELQGDRYVRVSEDSPNAEQMTNQNQGPEGKSTDGVTHTIVAREIPTAVLVFRDGHREEVSEYTIAGSVLYTRSNYYSDESGASGSWTSGSWIKKIDLLSLNLPATIASNQSRGVPFQLPNSPNEVIVGP
jgi:hypothetical protein